MPKHLALIIDHRMQVLKKIPWKYQKKLGRSVKNNRKVNIANWRKSSEEMCKYVQNKVVMIQEIRSSGVLMNERSFLLQQLWGMRGFRYAERLEVSIVL